MKAYLIIHTLQAPTITGVVTSINDINGVVLVEPILGFKGVIATIQVANADMLTKTVQEINSHPLVHHVEKPMVVKQLKQPIGQL